MTDSTALIESLLARVELLEDKLAITELLTTYSPAVDSGSADEVANLWLEDGVYDVDTGAMHGRGELRAMVHSTSHQNWIMNGAAHMMTPAHIRIDGNKAVATCHSQLVIKDPENPTGFKVLRITANRWELIKTDGEWKVELRTNALLDGRPEARALLAAGVTA
ncbi:nuclear transport factor 2 family protein [Rhodococcus qingshengii]|uniref:nuclear transport factor 2 family protein n=1 Tax=Rhodococcus qingshengii TaxID=334542 RepID=UPI0036D87F2C